jgi:hypothetical protein
MATTEPIHLTFRHKIETELCAVCGNITWDRLLTEDLGAVRHHKSLDALLDSAKSCKLCKLILHAATSNYQRSLEDKDSKVPRWRRYETLDTITHPDSKDISKVVMVKEFGACSPTTESESTKPGDARGGWLSPLPMDWTVGMESSSSTRAVFIHIVNENKEVNVPPVEDRTIPSDTLKAIVPTNYGIWVYGNQWSMDDKVVSLNDCAKDLSKANLVGIGARFASSAFIGDAINNPKKHIHIRGSALSTARDDGWFQ